MPTWYNGHNTIKEVSFMLKSRVLALFAALVLMCATFCPSLAEAQKLAYSAADIFEMCVPSVVFIETNNGGGTGFFVADNIIATNNHVINGAQWITVQNYAGEKYDVTTLLGRSENPDLALLQVDFTGPAVTVDTAPQRDGESIYAIGAPMGIYPCISDGIVMKHSHEDNGVDYILSNFHSIGGNSGGPVFNSYGDVVGIVVGGIVDGANAIDLVINAKYLSDLSHDVSSVLPTHEEYLSMMNRPDEENYVRADIKDAQVGQIISFGTYEKDNDFDNGAEEILWLVTDRNGDELTLISLYCIDVRPYHNEMVDITWEDCEVRTFLNTEFMATAFTDAEKAYILDTLVVNDDNPHHGTPGGEDTIDKVFLPSLQEVIDLYQIEDPQETFYEGVYAQATPYAISKGVWLEITDSTRCWWWLRSSGGNPQNACEVGSAGYLSFNGGYLMHPERALRPMMRIKAH